MKIQILSDLHIEFYKNAVGGYKQFLRPDSDTGLICAGDIGELKNPDVIAAMRYICSVYAHVWYVPGNHDSYGSSIEATENTLKTLESEIGNLTVLRTGEVKTIGDYKIVGDTGWVPNTPDLIKYKINDYRLIKDIQERIKIDHNNFRAFLNQVVDEKTIVVSHHMPTEACISPQFKGDKWNCWFLGDCSDIIDQKKPFMWCFGHTHDPFDFYRGSTRLICNPRGYPKENPNFKGPIEITI
jgi:predicted phosphodiesterase